MARIVVSTEVRAPSDVAFDYVDNHETVSQFLHGYSKLEWTTQRHDVGSRLKMEGRSAGVTMPIEFETTEVVPNSKIAGIYASGLTGKWEWLFEPTGDSTRVTFATDYELPLGILGQIADRTLVERETRSDLEKTLANLKSMAETKAPAAD